VRVSYKPKVTQLGSLEPAAQGYNPYHTVGAQSFPVSPVSLHYLLPLPWTAPLSLSAERAWRPGMAAGRDTREGEEALFSAPSWLPAVRRAAGSSVRCKQIS
jgi:hypothetical protein